MTRSLQVVRKETALAQCCEVQGNALVIAEATPIEK